jgi:hypothetical protein
MASRLNFYGYLSNLPLKMGVLLLVVFLSLNVSFVAQEYVPWESYFVADSVVAQEYDFEEHTSIHPRINKRRMDYGSTKDKSYLPKRWYYTPLADVVFGLQGNRDNLPRLRTGAGLAFDMIPIRGMHFRAAYIGGYASENPVNYQGGVYPFSFFRFNFNNGGVHYHDFRMRLSYSPNKFFNFQAGIDNNSFGEGDRSLLLGDHGTTYPFSTMRLKLWRAEYVLMHTYMHTPNSTNLNTFRPKHSTLHYLSLNLFKNFNISFFETVVHDGMIADQRRGFELEYLNPFVVYRPAEYGLGSSDRIQIGSNLSYRLSPKLMIYGQALIDDFLLKEIRERTGWWANKFGFQLGFKGQTKIRDGVLTYLSECNMVRPFTYAHTNEFQSFTNMNNPLAHPYGANFIENSTRLLYKRGAWDYALDFVYLLRGSNFSANESWGGDINMSNGLLPRDDNNQRIERGYFIGNGNKYNLAKLQATVGYQVFPQYRARAFATLESSWFSQSGQTINYLGFFVGFRSELWNDRRNY